MQIEMFGVTSNETGEESSQLLDEFVMLQKEIFSSLKLHYRFCLKSNQCLHTIGLTMVSSFMF